jgi:1-acyl-sn-glycerol-3-phosphate acyltransferase
MSALRGGDPLAFGLFDRVFLPWMRRRISVRIAGLPRLDDDATPLLLVANHVSWWDGFLLRRVQRILRPTAPLHTVMLASELRSRRILRVLGGTGIQPGSPATVARSVRDLRARARTHPNVVVAFFPQGRIWPSHRRPLGFERGVELFARGIPGARVLPIGIHIEPLHEVAPTAFLLAGEPVAAGSPGAGATALEQAVTDRIDTILRHLARHGENSLDAWSGPFESLPGGSP